MTVDSFVEQLKQHWSWLYEHHLSKLYTRQWAEWELVTIAGVLSLLLLAKVVRRRRKAAAALMHAAHFSNDPSIIGVRLSGGKRNGNGREELRESDEGDAPQGRRRDSNTANPAEGLDWTDRSIRELRREIIKRDQTEARLAREVSELSDANDHLEREVAGLMAANARLLRQVTQGKRVEELSTP